MRAPLLVCVSLLTFAGIARADGRPCKQLKRACIAAGYVKGGARQGHGLYRDCMKPALAGAAVTGLTVDAATVQACQARRAQRRHAGPPPSDMPPPKS